MRAFATERMPALYSVLCDPQKKVPLYWDTPMWAPHPSSHYPGNIEVFGGFLGGRGSLSLQLRVERLGIVVWFRVCGVDHRNLQTLRFQ